MLYTPVDVYLLERVMGIEPTCSAWKADVLPLNYTRQISTSPICYQYSIDRFTRIFHFRRIWHFKNTITSKNLLYLLQSTIKFILVEGVGFEPTKAEPTDLQSALVDRLSTPPKFSRLFWNNHYRCQHAYYQ